MTVPMPPGWYDDPDGSPNSERRWDGQQWTPEQRMKSGSNPQPAYPQPTPPPLQPPPPMAQMQYPPLPAHASYSPPPPYPQPDVHAQYPLPPQAQYANGSASSNLFSIIAFVCAGVSVLFCPILFGPAGLILGAVGLTKKERFAPIAIAAAAGGMIAGIVLGVAVWAN